MEYYSSLNEITYGSYILPIKRIELYSAKEWEEFIEEWLDVKKEDYLSTENSGGANDKGRDIVAYIDDPKINPNYYKWDCYQCKHYGNPITPSDVYVEFGKIIYYCFIEEYPVPRKYFFVAPKDCGSSLSHLLLKPAVLKDAIKENWKEKCQKGITKTREIPLEGKLLDYFETFDFSIFDKIKRKEVIEEHKKHFNHLRRFGGSLPARPKLNDDDVPSAIQAHEINYVKNLLSAYNSAGMLSVSRIEDLKGLHESHFKKARTCFHLAEQLRVLYRDSLPVDTFEDFQTEIHNGIQNTVESTHKDGFEKVKAVEDKAQQIQITSSPYLSVIKPQDRTGICHQLSNNGIINWENE
ncbi:MAG: hypothetical protein HXX14_01150 [Bacteroidetes bacterium]|nr:hypothetical protein [Bacteroidota bacterium]